jgi:allantoate deiminase
MTSTLGERVMQRLDELATCSDVAGELTRLYLSPAHKAAVAKIRTWMAEAGMAVQLDPAASVVGRYEAALPGAPTLLLGSHIDTVRNAGKYDGNLGVVAAIEAVAELHRAGQRLPFAVEVLAFGDEEGVRFPRTLNGSRAVAGTFDPVALDASDEQGTTLRDALVAFGVDPADIALCARRREDVLGYVELHIEQGPVLEAQDVPLGVVTAINGATRATFTLTGEAGHAGTVPMALRRDALTGAAEIVLGIERRCGAEPDLVGTVGRIEALPGAVNVIPGEARFTIDLRAPRDAQRRDALDDILSSADGIAGRRGLAVAHSITYDEPAAVCDPRLIAALEAAVEAVGVRPLRLPSGAGHDGLAMVALCPIGMLFLRCRGGVSHHPAESVTAQDVDVAVRALVIFLRQYRGASRADRP